MAKEILIEILLKNQQASRGLDDFKEKAKGASEESEKLNASQKEFIRVQKELKKAQDPLNSQIQEMKLEIKEYNAAAIQKAKIARDNANGVKQQVSAEELLGKAFSELTKEEKRLLIEERKRAVQLQINRKQVDLLAKAELGDARAKEILAAQTQKVTAAQKQGRAQSGLSNAILLETSRLASDASFGFTAIANNLSQVITLFQSFAKTEAGGFIPAIKRLGASLLGSGGILIGIQLLISFGPKLFDFFEGLIKRNKLLIDTFEKAAKTVESTKGNFEIYIKTLQSATKSAEEKQDAIKALNKDFPEFVNQLRRSGISMDDLKNSTIDAKNATDQFRESIKKLALSEAARQKITELQSQALQIQIERENAAREKGFKDLAEAQKEFESGEFSNQDAIAQTGTQVTTTYDEIFENAKAVATLRQDDLDQIEKDTQALLKFVDIQIDLEEETGESRSRNFKLFKAGRLDFEKDIINSQSRLLKSYAETAETELGIEITSRIQTASLRNKAFKERQDQRLSDFLRSQDLRVKQLKDEKSKIQESIDAKLYATEEEKNQIAEIDRQIANSNQIKAEAREKNDKAKRDADKSYADFIIQLNEESDVRLAEIEKRRNQRVIDLSIQNTDAQKKLDTELSLISEQIEGKRARARLDTQKSILDGQINRNKDLLANEGLTQDKRQELIQRGIKLEQQRTDIVMKLADAEAQAKVQSLEVVGNALTAFSSLAGENSAAGKALAVSGALISTYLSAQKAFESQFSPIALVDSPVRGALAAAAAVASGLANVKSILAVDSGGQSSVGGAQSNITATAPQFNVVGASQVNQLATAIGPIASQETKVNLVYEDFKGVEDNVTKTNVAAGLG